MTIHKLALEWEGITIDIKHDDEWSNMPKYDHYVHHIEIQRRNEGELPMTSTGYKSHFMFGTNKTEAMKPYESALDLVKAWLKESSESKEWKAYVENQKQLTLF